MGISLHTWSRSRALLRLQATPPPFQSFGYLGICQLVNGDVKSFRKKIEFRMNVDQPVNQNSADIFINLRLSLHVSRVWLSLTFYILHMLLNFSAVLTNMVDVSQGGSVYFRNVLGNVTLNTLLVHCLFCAEADLWQLIL